MKRQMISIAGAVLLLVSFSIVQAARSPVKVGGAAPDFELKDANGKTVKLSDFNGKIIVLEWTNPGCPFVQRHYREHTMANLASEYKDKGVVWLAINSGSDDGIAVNKAWVEKNHLAYPVLDDSKGTVGKEYGAKSTPHMFIIDRDGKLAYAGGIDNDPEGDNPHRVNYVKKALDELLAGQSVSTPVTKSYGCGVHYAQ